MGDLKLTTVEEMEAATARLLETGAKVGADAWQLRVKNQTPHCKFGEQGVCCRICAMGPCRITPKAPEQLHTLTMAVRFVTHCMLHSRMELTR